MVASHPLSPGVHDRRRYLGSAAQHHRRACPQAAPRLRRVTRDTPPAVGRGALDPAAPFSRSRLWTEIFGRDAALAIEIGAGDGTFLLGAAARRPEVDFFGIERSPAKARRLAARIAREGLPNVRSLGADATCVLALIPPASVAAY